MSTSCYTAKRLSRAVWRIEDSDEFGETPFIYVITGDCLTAVVDTGCGSANLCEFIRTTILCDGSVSSDVLVINTHNHFDHVGANHLFSKVAVGSAAQSYTLDQFNNVGWAKGCKVVPFTVTKWLENGEKIRLSANDEAEHLEVIFCPGHTPDSLALYYPPDKRLFVGDLIYTDAPLLAITLQCSLASYQRSAELLVEFVRDKERDGSKIRLCCGHVNDSLPSDQLAELAELLDKVNSGQLTGSGSALFKEYNHGGLRLVVRKCTFADRFLAPVLRLFF